MNHSCRVSLTKEQQVFFSAPLELMSFPDWLTLVSEKIENGHRRLLLAHHNVHSLYLLQKNEQVRKFYARSDHCYIDGVPVRWILATLGIRSAKEQRFSLMHEFPHLLKYASEKRWRVFYCGSSKDVVRQAGLLCRQQFPDLSIQFCDGYLGNDERLVDTINKVAPDLLLVGMGMPRQEGWLLENIDKLDVGVATHAGGTLDYYAGVQAKPPRWLSDAGGAWIFRLMCDPVRLWRRYLVEPLLLLGPLSRLWWTGH